MKFKIRFADQIVGFFIVLSLVSLVFVIVMLGRSQRWFAKDASFSTILPSAGGLGKNMAVQYRGFTIGNVKTFHLTENDEVEVIFTIHEEYSDRAKQGSVVEMMISPVGLGNQFLFHAGRGEVLEEGAFIPVAGSAQAQELIRQGLAVELKHDDSISVLMNKASTLLDNINRTLAQVNEALGPGTDATEIGKMTGSIQRTLSGVEELPQSLDRTIITANRTIDGIRAEIEPLLANVNAIVANLNAPDGLLSSVLDTDKEVYTGLVQSLGSVQAILGNLERATAFIPAQLPQLAGIIADVRVTMKSVEDVLVALTNNPLLKQGVPERIEDQAASGTNPRNIRF